MRDYNIRMLWDTLDILSRGSYETGGKTVRLKLSRSEMMEAEVYLPEDVKKVCRAKDFDHVGVIGRCGYGVENADSFSLARKRMEERTDPGKDDKPVLVLNLANATSPGGGVRRGALLQL